MRQVIPDVFLLEGLRASNVYLLVSGRELMLVDTGLVGEAGRIAIQIQDAGYALSELRAIVLTHAHGDHAGNVIELARRSHAQVLAHRDEVPYIERTRPLPAAFWLQRLLMWLGDRVVFRLPPCRVDRGLENGERIGFLGGLQVIHTPGHTPGSLCLYHPERRILFSGDTLLSRSPIMGRGAVYPPMLLFTVDRAQAWESVRRLSALSVEVLCPGHGPPVLTGAGEQIRTLLGVRRRHIPQLSGTGG